MTAMAEEVLDDDLTLLLAKGGGVPRLGIFNTNTNKKKYAHMSWAEVADRSLKIKIGKAGSKEYPMDVVRGAIARLIKRAEDDLTLKMLTWRGVQVIGDLLHMPKSARNEVDCNLIAEGKRDTLWFAFTPKDGEWRVRPCFIQTDEERRVLSAHVAEGKPWPAVPIPSGQLPFTMRNTGAAKELFLAAPERWSEFLLPLSKALTFGFSDWSPNGEHNFGDALWKYLPTKDFRSEDALGALASAGRPFLRQMTVYLRLWPVVNKIDFETLADSAKAADERGLKKRDRFEIVAPHRGDKRFIMTRYQDDAGMVVTFGVVPATRLPGEPDRVFSVTNDDWEACLDACSLGGQQDPQFTCNSLLCGVETKNWYDAIRPCLTGQ